MLTSLCGPFGCWPKGLPVVMGMTLTLNRFVWIVQQGLREAEAKNLSHTGMGNYKSEPPLLRVKTMGQVHEDKLVVFHGESSML